MFTLKHVLGNVEVEAADVELHGPLLRTDHGVRVVPHPVLLRLAGLDHHGHTQQLLPRQTQRLGIRDRYMSKVK